jgi:hypothetical protein
LTPDDIQEVLSNLKSTEGLGQAGAQELLAAVHLAGRTSAAHSATILTSISDVKNANRLAPNQSLLFAETGITLIYGYNGSSADRVRAMNENLGRLYPSERSNSSS